MAMKEAPMIAGLRPKESAGERADGGTDRRAHGRQEGIFEGASDADALLDEERRKPGDNP